MWIRHFIGTVPPIWTSFGDEVIKLVGRVCRDNSGENTIVGRFGGDEFVIILKGITLENGKQKAQQLAEAVKNMKIT